MITREGRCVKNEQGKKYFVFIVVGEIHFWSKNAETKREEFRKYLESNGILDALTKVLVGLYEEPEKPMDPLEYPFYQHTHA